MALLVNPGAFNPKYASAKNEDTGTEATWTVPYFISAAASSNCKGPRGEDGDHSLEFFFDIAAHVGSWVAVIVLDIILLANKFNDTDHITHRLQVAGFVPIAVSLGCILLLWGAMICMPKKLKWCGDNTTFLASSITGIVVSSLRFSTFISKLLLSSHVIVGGLLANLSAATMAPGGVIAWMDKETVGFLLVVVLLKKYTTVSGPTQCAHCAAW